MISLKQIYNKTHEYIFRRKCSSETQQQISPPPAKSVYNSILGGPFETYFRTLLRLLIWEQPYLSAVAFVTLNIFYWLIVSWNRRFYSILSIFGIFIFLHRTWTCYCWPKLKVPPQDKEDTESWTEIECHSSSSVIIRDMVEKAAILMKDVWKLRKENRGLFCSLMCGFFSFLAFVGKVFPGVLLVYGLVLFMTLGPGIMLHLVPETIFEQFKGFFNESDGQASPTTTGPSDRDSDLEEFVPELSPETFRQLSLRDDNLEGQNLSSLEPESLPAFGEESYNNESEDFSLYQGLGSFPSVEEENESDLDDSDKIILSEKTTPAERTTEMHFDPKHFKEDSSSGSEDQFTEGLSFAKKEGATTGKEEQKTTLRRSSLSDEDELADFEILEESDIPT